MEVFCYDSKYVFEKFRHLLFVGEFFFHIYLLNLKENKTARVEYIIYFYSHLRYQYIYFEAKKKSLPLFGFKERISNFLYFLKRKGCRFYFLWKVCCLFFYFYKLGQELFQHERFLF